MKIKKILAIAVCTIVLSTWFSFPVFASWVSVSGGGYYSIGDTVYVDISVGEETEFYAIAGSLSFDGSVLSGPTSFAVPGDFFGSAKTTVALTVVGYGSTSVYVDANYSDGEGNYYAGGDSTWVEVPEEKGGSAEEPNEDNWEDSYWDDEIETPEHVSEAETESTVADPNAEKLNVTLNGNPMKVLKEFEHANADKAGGDSAITTQKAPALEWLPELVGFTKETVDFEGNDVNVFRLDEALDVYVLTDSDGANGVYCVYDKKTQSFSCLPYLYVGSKLVVFLDYPDDEGIPEEYELCEIDVGPGKVKALKFKAEKKGSSLIPLTAADPEDFYIIVGVAEGQKGYYSYDAADKSAQRLNIQGEVEETEGAGKETKTTVSRPETETKESKTVSSDTLFYILLVVAALLVIAAIVIIIVLAGKNKKNKQLLQEKREKRVAAAAPGEIVHEVQKPVNTKVASIYAKNNIPAELRRNPVKEKSPAEKVELPDFLENIADEVADKVTSAREE